MIQVLRNHTHKSKIILSAYKYGEKPFYRKASYHMDGINDLVREYNGYLWYLDRVDYCMHIEQHSIRDRYLELRIPFFDSDTPASKSITRENFDYYLAAIDHYKKVWSFKKEAGDLFPVHGDYSLDGNILFNGNDIFIIDWEHFTENAAPLGFDILYMVFESIKIRCGTDLPGKNTLDIGIELIKYARYIDSIDDQKEKLPTAQLNSNQLSQMLSYYNFRF